METHFSKKTAFYASIPLFFVSLLEVAQFVVPNFMGTILAFAFIFSMFALFMVGWVKNFPRWSLPAIGFCILISLYFMHVSVPLITRNLLGLWAFLPLLITLIISIVLKPSLLPLKQLFRNIRKYPALVFLMLFGFAPFFNLILIDEVSASYLIPATIFNTLVLTSGLFIFLTHQNRATRNLTIIGAFFISILASCLHIFL